MSVPGRVSTGRSWRRVTRKGGGKAADSDRRVDSHLIVEQILDVLHN
jgi:hypothetical protein